MLYIFSDPDDDKQTKRRHSRAADASTWILRAAILLASSAPLLNCCSSQSAPVIVGQAQVLAVDNRAGTVTITLALYRRMVLRLKDCQKTLPR